ncbi:MAG: hypothetical protein DLM52_13365 [Chthoniobacterales bacterium]|nr:MAG: hypothetical protein DLM52_13365 [Chthoniobacterales bacterium]
MIRRESFERDILNAYAWPALRLGDQYEHVGARAEAHRWYERAFGIDPELPGLRASLARVE